MSLFVFVLFCALLFFLLFPFLFVSFPLSLFSSFQLFFFRLQAHPRNAEFLQCVTFDSFKETWLERWYSVANVVFLYGLPLIVILICYIQICLKSFSRRSKSCEKPSGAISRTGENTNEALGPSSLILPIRQDEDEEIAPGDEDEENGEDDDDDDEHVFEKRVPLVECEERDENEDEEEQGENEDDEKCVQVKNTGTRDVPNGVKDEENVSKEKKASFKSKLKYVHGDESDVNQKNLMDGERQSMLMSSLTVTSSHNSLNASTTKTTTDSGNYSAAGTASASAAAVAIAKVSTCKRW